MTDGSRAPSILERIPAGRWGDSRRLQGSVLFLASEPRETRGGLMVAGWHGEAVRVKDWNGVWRGGVEGGARREWSRDSESQESRVESRRESTGGACTE